LLLREQLGKGLIPFASDHSKQQKCIEPLFGFILLPSKELGGIFEIFSHDIVFILYDGGDEVLSTILEPEA